VSRRLAPVVLVTAASCTDLGGLSGGDDAGIDRGAPGDAAPDAPAPPPVDASDDAAMAPDTVSPDAGADAATSFSDGFDRPDGGAIGAGWIMKYAPAFALESGAVVRLYPDATHDFVDNLVYRPGSEALLDVAVSIELKLAVDPPGYPQVHARVQPSSVTTPGQLDSYFLYVANAMSVLHVARQHGASNGYVDLATITLSPPLNTTDTYRMRLDVKGATTVALTGTIEKKVGNGWQVLGSSGATDADPSAITTPGTAGFSGGLPESARIYAYDNFTRTPL
jgi:hypothetical protein